MLELPLVARIRAHADRVVVASEGSECTYADLLRASGQIASALLDGAADLNEARVAFLACAGFEYLAILLAIWRAGGMALPLSPAATQSEIANLLLDADVRTVVATQELIDQLGEAAKPNRRVMVYESAMDSVASRLPEVASHRRAMILYTSGTTSHPKGVVTTHANIEAQIGALIEAWEWRMDDRIPLFLPMHHIHGIVNVAACGLWAGARIEPFSRFDLPAVFSRVAMGAYSLFMAVPTIYVKMIEALDGERFPADFREKILRGFAGMRLMVSGSAALPASVHEKWQRLTGQSLLERYGMTETGMILSHSLRGERRPGTVGRPLPSVQVRLKSESGAEIAGEGEPGEIQTRGPGVFREYWNRLEATAEVFDDGWFRTGDIGVIERGDYRILGRLSVDVIKSGGFKLSALEIEAVLLEHPAIRECAVVGLADETWGEVVAVAAVASRPAEKPDLPALQAWSETRLSRYKLPRRLIWVEDLPRNAMGKVQKRKVGSLFSPF